MTQNERAMLAKVPAVTLGFWIIKILATTLGETGGDSVTMSWLGETTDHPVPYGYLIGTAIFGVLLVGLVIAQIRAKKFNPWLYWATIVASTTCGTTLADFADRSLGIGYPGGSLLLLACVLLSLFAWWRNARHRQRQHRLRPARRDLLLDHDHFLADPRHRARRLERRPAERRRLGPRLRRRRTGLRRRPRRARDPLFLDEGRAASACSGRRSSSPAHLERRSATSSTNRWRKAVLL